MRGPARHGQFHARVTSHFPRPHDSPEPLPVAPPSAATVSSRHNHKSATATTVRDAMMGDVDVDGCAICGMKGDAAVVRRRAREARAG